MDGRGLKNKFSNNNKIVIYQQPLVNRIILALSALVLTAIPIACLLMGYEGILEMVVCLLAMMAYCVLVYFSVFKTYICLDMESNTLIIREFPGYKQKVFSAYQLSSLTVSDGTPENNQHAYTLDLNFVGLTVKLNSWSVGYGAWLTAGINRKRLEKFCEKCNQYLNSRQK